MYKIQSLDSWSRGKTVVLSADLDLSDVEFSSIPVSYTHLEIRAICGVEHHARGIDNGEHGPLAQALTVAKQAARQFHTVVLLSGKTDLITNGVCAFGVENGDPLMARVTGTGCMQGAVVAAFLAVASP